MVYYSIHNSYDYSMIMSDFGIRANIFFAVFPFSDGFIHSGQTVVGCGTEGDKGNNEIVRPGVSVFCHFLLFSTDINIVESPASGNIPDTKRCFGVRNCWMGVVPEYVLKDYNYVCIFSQYRNASCITQSNMTP